MFRLLALLIAVFTASGSANSAPAITFDEIASPAGPGATGASLTTGPEGTVWLTWLEPAAGETALRFSTFDATTRAWTAARTISRGSNWFVNWADFPALTAGPGGRATAVWFVNNPAPESAAPVSPDDHHGPGYRAFLSHTTDFGRTWSEPAPLTTESNSVEFVSLVTLADGRVLAAWLDGRLRQMMAGHGHAAGALPMQLYVRILFTETNAGPPPPDTLIDASVCDCCQTALTAFPDGSALLAYRGREEGEVRDIRVARFRGERWEDPRTLHRDHWQIPGCPVNGPQIASDGGRVAAAWFTAAGGEARVLASFSSDAGGRFVMPLRLDEARPAGRVSTVLLHNGSMLVTWLAVEGQLWLRRISPEYVPAAPVLLGSPGSSRAKGFPRITLLRDYAGGKSTAQLIAAYARDGAESGLRTVLLTVPEGDLLEADANCQCAPTPEQLRGYAIRGTLETTAGAGVVRVTHPELPGLLPAGTHDLRVEPALREKISGTSGRAFFGRMERREGRWWLIDVRWIGN
jgi:hypothetical protein